MDSRRMDDSTHNAATGTVNAGRSGLLLRSHRFLAPTQASHARLNPASETDMIHRRSSAAGPSAQFLRVQDHWNEQVKLKQLLDPDALLMTLDPSEDVRCGPDP